MTTVSGVAIKTLHTNIASIGGLELGSVALTTEDGVAGTRADWHGQQTQSLLLVFLSSPPNFKRQETASRARYEVPTFGFRRNSIPRL